LAIEDAQVSLTNQALNDQVQDAARGLLALGLDHGDRVGIWAPNVWEWVVFALAVHGIGGVLVPINTRYKGPEAAYILRRSGARILATVQGFLGADYVGMLVGQDLPEWRHTVILRGQTPEGCLSWQQLGQLGTNQSTDAVVERTARVTADDLSDILFTSGTTGHPKGVPTTHGQSVRAFWDWSGIVGIGAEDRYLVVAPFFHCFGYKAGWLAALMRGAVILPQATFDVPAVLARIAPDRVTVLPGPPALYQTLLAHPEREKHDLSSLRLAVTGAAVIPVGLIQDMKFVLGFDTVITGYGLTEASGVVTMCRSDDDFETIASWSGRAIPGVEVRVVGPDGEEVSPEQPGEVVVRGYNVMAGYLDEADETAQVLQSDGWLHTGDVGVMDARGYLRITDRIKDMFIVGGFNAYPAEIERVLRSHPGIADVAVIGVPDPRLGEVGMAWIVPSDEPVLAEELARWSRDRMANFKVPRRVENIGELPRNALGKVRKVDLRARARQVA
jgi:acyl-CoA synthetase (AMP-forming)/AMP-acid ligase II